MYSEANLILNSDGSIYHLKLQPTQIAPLIIFVGDPQRVGEVSKHFDKIEHKVQSREFVTHTGIWKNKPISVVSTGIGTDNVEIVMTEIDALFNIDFATRLPKDRLTALNFIRVGTSGSIRADIEVDSLVLSEQAIGFDSLMHFYNAPQTADEFELCEELSLFLEAKNEDFFIAPYAFKADSDLLRIFGNDDFKAGTTLTAPGFYAPQGRVLRAAAVEPRLVKLLGEFNFRKTKITNFEMETSGIYGMARALGHKAVSVSAILANRITGKFSENPANTIDKLIEKVLSSL
jgi:uridine phosphorylase